MYEAPPGAKRERQKEDDEPEYKFEWQRKYNAPREDYAKGNADIKDQPFGIPVRNVRCIKCHKWGHINTDRECPLFSQAGSSSMPTTSMDPMELMRQMREDGYGLKENVLGHRMNPKAANQQFIASDESDPEAEFLNSLSIADKKKLLRKLKKLSKKQEKSKKKKKKKAKKHKSKHSSGSDSDSCKKTRKKSKKKFKESSSSSDNSSSENSCDDDEDKDTASKASKDRKMASIRSRSLSKSASKAFDKDHRKSSKKRTKESSEIKMKKRIRKGKAESEDSEPDVGVVNSRWKSSSSDSDDPNIKSKKPKAEEYVGVKEKDSSRDDSTKQTTKPLDCKHGYTSSEDIDPEKRRKEFTETDEKNSKTVKTANGMEHPDGFSHSCPQAVVKTNDNDGEQEYDGGIHDKFRHFNRQIRSPSVKQKYNK